jgi:hypothetical protein
VHPVVTGRIKPVRARSVLSSSRINEATLSVLSAMVQSASFLRVSTILQASMVSLTFRPLEVLEAWPPRSLFHVATSSLKRLSELMVPPNTTMPS